MLVKDFDPSDIALQLDAEYAESKYFTAKRRQARKVWKKTIHSLFCVRTWRTLRLCARYALSELRLLRASVVNNFPS